MIYPKKLKPGTHIRIIAHQEVLKSFLKKRVKLQKNVLQI